MSKIKYIKPALSVSEQVKLLLDKGLIIDDCKKAEQFLLCTNYYRLSGYWLNKLETKNPADKFIKGTTFNDIISIYRFDCKLRSFLFDGISKFEVSFRTQWAYNMSTLGAFSYKELQNAISEKNHWENINKTLHEYDRSTELFVEHYKNTYIEYLPPVWIVCEIFSFGTLSCWYKNLVNGKIKDKIAEFYHIDSKLCESWLHSISVLRNFCAHQARLVNKKFPVIPKKPKSKNVLISEIWTDEDSFYNILLILVFLNYIF